MGQQTGIEWCSHTFNPWRGCTKVSPGCTHCYAETLSKRNPKVLGEWGPDGTRVIASESMWKQPLKWDRAAEQAGERRRVFCASLADVFEDRKELNGPRERLFFLIEQTPHLDWLLLTKRPDFAHYWMCEHYATPSNLPNIWMGVSVEDQERANERIPELLRIPAAVRFLSVEPLLAPVDLTARACFAFDWVIIGGESGPGARPCHTEWIRSIRDQCRGAGVACFVKQLGSNSQNWVLPGVAPIVVDDRHCTKFRDKKGGNWSEWPEDLRVREFPR